MIDEQKEETDHIENEVTDHIEQEPHIMIDEDLTSEPSPNDSDNDDTADPIDNHNNAFHMTLR